MDNKTVDKVRGIIFNIDKGKIAIICFNDTNAFLLPGGKQEIGETKQEALIREIKEETGIHIKKNEHLPWLYNYEFERTLEDKEGKKYRIKTNTTFYLIETNQDFNYRNMKLSSSEKSGCAKPYWINPAILEYKLDIALRNGTYTTKNKYFDRYAKEDIEALRSFYKYQKKKSLDLDNYIGG